MQFFSFSVPQDSDFHRTIRVFQGGADILSRMDLLFVHADDPIPQFDPCFFCRLPQMLIEIRHSYRVIRQSKSYHLSARHQQLHRTDTLGKQPKH